MRAFSWLGCGPASFRWEASGAPGCADPDTPLWFPSMQTMACTASEHLACLHGGPASFRWEASGAPGCADPGKTLCLLDG